MKTLRQNQTARPVKAGKREGASSKVAALALRRILVPMDFSGKSRQALEVAVPLAQQYDGKIFLIHVVEPVYTGTPFPGQVTVTPADMRPLVVACREKLDALARELVPPELLGTTLVRSGRAHLEIIDAADKLEADLIALSTHGHTGLKHVLLGSTAEHVVRHAHCPVLTVRQHGADAGRLPVKKAGNNLRPAKPGGPCLPWRRILVPIDFSNLSFQALDTGVPLARDLGARLFLLSVVEPPVYPGGMEATILATPDAELVEEAKAELPKIAKRFIPPSVSVTVLVEQGLAFDAITRVAQEMKIDLIVLASHGRTGLDRILLGSTAERVVRHAHCPVYVIHRKANRDRLLRKSSPAGKSKTN